MTQQHILAAAVLGALSAIPAGAQAASIDASTLPLTSLQSLLDSRTLGGTSSIDVNTDESKAQVFAFQSTGASATYIASISPTAGSLKFGLYDVYRPTETLLLFDTGGTLASAPGDSTQLYIEYNPLTGQAMTLSYEVTGGFPPVFTVHDTATFASPSFGFYLTSGAGTWYSQPHLNAANGDVNGDGVPDTDHFLAYVGQGDRFDARGDKIFLNDVAHWYIAGEASTLAGFGPQDYDFTDFVVQLESVQPVPEPATAAMFGVALLGLAAVARRRAQRTIR